MQYYAKLEARDAAAAVSRAPEAAASALGTAGEILAGAAGHVVDKVGPSHNMVLTEQCLVAGTPSVQQQGRPAEA